MFILFPGAKTKHRIDGLPKQKFVSHSSGGRKSHMSVPWQLCFSEGHFQVEECWILPACRNTGVLPRLFYTDTHLVHKGVCCCLNMKSPPQADKFTLFWEVEPYGHG